MGSRTLQGTRRKVGRTRSWGIPYSGNWERRSCSWGSRKVVDEKSTKDAKDRMKVCCSTVEGSYERAGDDGTNDSRAVLCDERCCRSCGRSPCSESHEG